MITATIKHFSSALREEQMKTPRDKKRSEEIRIFKGMLLEKVPLRIWWESWGMQLNAC